MGIVWTIIIGFIAGVVAKFIMPGSNEPAGFVLTTRIGKWTYYRRNEQAIADFAARLKIEL